MTEILPLLLGLGAVFITLQIVIGLFLAWLLWEIKRESAQLHELDSSLGTATRRLSEELTQLEPTFFKKIDAVVANSFPDPLQLKASIQKSIEAQSAVVTEQFATACKHMVEEAHRDLSQQQATLKTQLSQLMSKVESTLLTDLRTQLDEAKQNQPIQIARLASEAIVAVAADVLHRQLSVEEQHALVMDRLRADWNRLNQSDQKEILDQPVVVNLKEVSS